MSANINSLFVVQCRPPENAQVNQCHRSIRFNNVDPLALRAPATPAQTLAMLTLHKFDYLFIRSCCDCTVHSAHAQFHCVYCVPIDSHEMYSKSNTLIGPRDTECGIDENLRFSKMNSPFEVCR